MASDDDRKEHHEGPEAARQFESTLKRVLSVPKAELDRREAAYQKQRKAKARTRSSSAR
jgi:hypothetical protein